MCASSSPLKARSAFACILVAVLDLGPPVYIDPACVRKSRQAAPLRSIKIATKTMPFPSDRSSGSEHRIHHTGFHVFARGPSHEGRLHFVSFLLFPSKITDRIVHLHNRPCHPSARAVPCRHLVPSSVPCLLPVPSCPVHARQRSCAHTG